MNAAEQNAERGFAVFPLKVGEKTPATPDHAANKCSGRDPRCRTGHQGWEPRATTDPDRIRRGWSSAAYNIGVACGPSRLVVVDLDTHGELPEDWQLPGIADGKDVLAQICEWGGVDWPWTFTVRTPSDGWHLYFRAPDDSTFGNTTGKIGPMVDTRARGGYVVGAGSITAAGEYEVLYDEPIQPLPRWIARLLAPAEPEQRSHAGTVASGPGRLQGLVRTVESARPGTRNNALFWAAATLAEFAPQDMDQIAAAAARSGLDEREIARTIHSARLRVGAL